VETSLLLDVLKSSAAYSRIMDRKGPKMIAKDFSPEARLAQHRKDVGLILRMAERCEAKVPLSNLHAQLLDQAISSGWGDLDNSAVVEIFRESHPEKGRS
jgi:3-hydroxyisobutyrate dehydrogenase-like beta-hydroxyacid dehydrogenase